MAASIQNSNIVAAFSQNLIMVGHFIQKISGVTASSLDPTIVASYRHDTETHISASRKLVSRFHSVPGSQFQEILSD